MPATSPESAGTILAIDLPAAGDLVAKSLPGWTIRHLRSSDLDPDTLCSIGASALLIPLFASARDVTALLADLERWLWPGQVVLVSPPLPRPAVVLDELTELAPSLRLKIIEIAP